MIIHSLNGGGAEHSVAMLANAWTAAGNAVTIITLDTPDTDIYRLDAQVQRIGLHGMQHSQNVVQAIWNNFRRLRGLRAAIRAARGDHVISFTEKMNVLSILAMPGKSVIACERTDPRRHAVGPVWSALRRLTYRRARAIVVQTRAVSDYARRFVPSVPIHVIPNAVQANDLDVPRGQVIIGLGRLAHEKGFDLLIESFAAVAAQYPSWQLVIYGEGPERQALQARIEHHGLSQRIALPGWTDNPQLALASARIFVLPSRYEGFPNGLLEAMAASLAVVSFNCDSGPREIIRHEQDGLLVTPARVDELATALASLLCDESLRTRLAENARSVVERFSIERHLAGWEEVLASGPNSTQKVQAP